MKTEVKDSINLNNGDEYFYQTFSIEIINKNFYNKEGVSFIMKKDGAEQKFFISDVFKIEQIAYRLLSKAADMKIKVDEV